MAPRIKGLFRASISVKEIPERTWAEIRSDDVFGRSAQLAYFFFLALFPFLIFVISSLSLVGTADRGRIILFAVFARFLPPPAFQLISTTFNGILQSGGPLKMSFGIVFAVWSATAGVTATMDTLNTAYDAKESRSLFKQYATAIGLTLGIGLLLVLVLMVVAFGDTLLSPAGSAAVAVWHIAQWPLAIALLLLVIAALYYFAPDLENPRWHWITPGAVLALCLMAAASIALRIYLHYFGNYNSTYGSLGAVIILLLCFYVAAVAVLSGAALNGVLERMTREKEKKERSCTSHAKPPSQVPCQAIEPGAGWRG